MIATLWIVFLDFLGEAHVRLVAAVVRGVFICLRGQPCSFIMNLRSAIRRHSWLYVFIVLGVTPSELWAAGVRTAT